MRELYEDIELFKTWKKVNKLNKGWSKDKKKYYVEDFMNRRFLLRINDIETMEDKKKEFEIIKKYNKLSIPMSIPYEFGVCNGGKNVYMLLSWINGQDLKDVLPSLEVEKQYLLGRKAGEILRKIHGIPIEEKDMISKTKIPKKLYQLEQYIKSNVRIQNDEIAINYIKNNIENICREKPVYEHGDFHPGNIIYTSSNELGIIDFNRWEVGDPYEEFYKLESFGVEVSIPYCIGQIDSYFKDDIPIEFWKALSVYVAHASLISIKWAESFGNDEVNAMIERCNKSFYNYDNFKRLIPKWYDEKFKEKMKWNIEK